MLPKQVTKVIPILAGVFSAGYKVGQMGSEKPSFPVRPIIRTEETVVYDANGSVTVSKSKELFASKPYDVFANSIYYPNWEISTLEIMVGGILVLIFIYHGFKYFTRT